jgi:hypothetical protein
MFKIESRDLTTAEARLLFDIRELLIKRDKNPLAKNTGKKPTAPQPCKYCGGVHENKGGVLACAKKSRRMAQTMSDKKAG